MKKRTRKSRRQTLRKSRRQTLRKSRRQTLRKSRRQHKLNKSQRRKYKRIHRNVSQKLNKTILKGGASSHKHNGVDFQVELKELENIYREHNPGMNARKTIIQWINKGKSLPDLMKKVKKKYEIETKQASSSKEEEQDPVNLMKKLYDCERKGEEDYEDLIRCEKVMLKKISELQVSKEKNARQAERIKELEEGLKQMSEHNYGLEEPHHNLAALRDPQ